MTCFTDNIWKVEPFLRLLSPPAVSTGRNEGNMDALKRPETHVSAFHPEADQILTTFSEKQHKKMEINPRFHPQLVFI